MILSKVFAKTLVVGMCLALGIAYMAWRYVSPGSDELEVSRVAPQPTPDVLAETSTREQGAVPFDAWCRGRTDVTCVKAGAARGFVVQPDNPSADLVVWDLGGPGVGLPDEDIPWDVVLPSSISNSNVLIVAEPWTTTPPNVDCLEGPVRAPVAASCHLDLLMTDPEATVDLIMRAGVETGSELTGLYARSFGATRVQSILSSGRLRPEWVILESPAPTRGTPARSVMESRVNGLRDALLDGCTTTRCAGRFDQVLMWADSGLIGLSGREFALGLLATATLPEQNAGVLKRIAGASEMGEMDESLLGKIRRAGRAYERRGNMAVAPSLIGLWADTCPAYSDWHEITGTRNGFTDALAWVFRGCTDESQSSHTAPDSSDVSSLMGWKFPTLILNARSDSLVSPELQSRWQDIVTNAETWSVPGEHGRNGVRVAPRVSKWIQALRD